MPLKSSEVSSQLNVHEESWISSMRLFYMFDSFDDPLPSLPSSRQKLRLLFPACIVVGTGYWAAQKGLFLPQFHQGAAPRRPAAGSSPKATEFNPWTAPPPPMRWKTSGQLRDFQARPSCLKAISPPPTGESKHSPPMLTNSSNGQLKECEAEQDWCSILQLPVPPQKSLTPTFTLFIRLFISI